MTIHTNMHNLYVSKHNYAYLCRYIPKLYVYKYTYTYLCSNMHIYIYILTIYIYQCTFATIAKLLNPELPCHYTDHKRYLKSQHIKPKLQIQPSTHI